MQYRMTVRAHRPQVLGRIDLVLTADLRQRAKMVDMDEAIGHRTIGGTEGEPADDAGGAVLGDAELPGTGITLVGVDRDLIPSPLQ